MHHYLTARRPSFNTAHTSEVLVQGSGTWSIRCLTECDCMLALTLLQRKRHRLAKKKAAQVKAKQDAAEYQR